jgi:hypothetical protein
MLPRLPECELHFSGSFGQQGTEPDLRIYAVVHRCEVVVLEFASFSEGGIATPFCLDVLVPVQRVQRAEERTRTAYPCSLRVITQALQGAAWGCKCRIFRRVSFLRLAPCCTVLRSRWCQEAPAGSAEASQISNIWLI